MASPTHLIKQITYMQTFITKLRAIIYIAAFFYTGLCSAAASFGDYFQIKSEIESAIANRITHYYSEDVQLSTTQQQVELLKLESQLIAIESSHTDRAIYWFIRGLNDRNLAAHYTHINKQETANKYIKNKNNAYKNALKLAKNNPQILSAAIYSTMKHGLPQDLKIKATQFELAQGGNVDNESAYWYLHWSNVDQLKKAGRHDEADKAFHDMQKAMQEKNVDMSIYADFNKQVEKQTLKISEKQATSTKKEEAEENELISKEVVMPALLIIALLSLALVTVYEFFIKRK
jgi:hypothetical protein